MQMQKLVKGRIAWGLAPHFGGPTIFYLETSAALRSRGWEVFSITAGRVGAREVDRNWADEFSEILLPECGDPRQCAIEFIKWVEERKIDIVFPVFETFIHAAVPALPRSVRVVGRCESITRQAYSLTTANLGRTELIVVQTPRQRDDLCTSWGVPAGKCRIIPNGVNVDVFHPFSRRDFNGVLRLIYVGRIDENTKCVLMLPKIAAQLKEAAVNFHLDVVGEGPHMGWLQSAFQRCSARDAVRYHG